MPKPNTVTLTNKMRKSCANLNACWQATAKHFFLALFILVCAAPDIALAKSLKKKAIKAPAKVGQVQSTQVHFSKWLEVNQFIDQLAAKSDFTREQLIQIFDNAKYADTAVQLMKPAPPGRPKNWKAYRARFVEPRRIDAGVAFWNQYAEALTRAEVQTGVPAEIIVGLIGVETVFGQNTGNFRVVDALTTLAFDYPDTPSREARMSFFRKELETLLLLSRDTKTDPFSYMGSYAGAIGWPQFMPSSIKEYALDFDGDGKIDLSHSPVDAIGSVANYLAQHGWKRSMPTVFPATLINATETSTAVNAAIAGGLKAGFTLEELKPFVSTASREASAQFLYGLIDLQNGDDATEYWLATDNFFAITQYNRSYFYAMSVIDLGRVIALTRSSTSTLK